MVITDYRVQSVLRTYTKQLQRSKLARRLDGDDPKTAQEKVNISEEGRRRMIMDNVASQAFEQAYSSHDETNENHGMSYNGN